MDYKITLNKFRYCSHRKVNKNRYGKFLITKHLNFND